MGEGCEKKREKRCRLWRIADPGKNLTLGETYSIIISDKFWNDSLRGGDKTYGLEGDWNV